MKMQSQVLFGAVLIALAILFQPQIQSRYFSDAHAKVGGMDAWDLKYDWDFKKAVHSIVEDCSVLDTTISC